MVFVLVGEHVPSHQAKLQLDRMAKLQGGIILFFVPRRPIFDINTKRQLIWEKKL